MSATKCGTRDSALAGLIASGRYLFGFNGRIFDRVRNEFRKTLVEADGHETVCLWDKDLAPGFGSVRVGRIFAIAYLGLPKHKKMMVLHKDGNPLNNVPSNLAWATPKEISRQAHTLGNVPHPVGEDFQGSTLTANQVRSIRRALADGQAMRKIAAAHGVTKGAVDGIKYGKTWGHLK